MKMLITGNKSGLGKYLFENLGGIGWDRNTSFKTREKIKKSKIDIIIHCAFNSSREITSESLFSYVEDNVFLTKELVSIPHKKFIFFSSVDVYPKNKKNHSEKEIINPNYVEGIYGITKLISESIIRNYCKNYLILRGSAFLGKYSRKNSLIRIIEDEKGVLTLAGDSEFNYVLYPDILDFLKIAIKKDLKGIYNLTSLEKITLSEIAKNQGKKIRFGNYLYTTGEADNTKIYAVCPALKKTSKQAINLFIKERKK